MKRSLKHRVAFGFVTALLTSTAALQTAFADPATCATKEKAIPVVHYRTATIDGVSMFYREAGPADGPVVLLLHGFPTSSDMFRNLIPALPIATASIAPDYPGFGQSAMPDHTEFAYTFGHYADMVDGFLQHLGCRVTQCM